MEKFTAERKARPKDQRDARRVCKACYKAAVRAEQEASAPLPGTVDVSRCERVTAGIGKCSVCGLVRAEWIDREVGVKLCEHCYGRGLGAVGRCGVRGMKTDNEIIAITFTNRKGFCPLLSAICPLSISPFPFKFSAVLIFL